MKPIGPRVGVSFKWQTPTLGQNLDSGGLWLRLHTPDDYDDDEDDDYYYKTKTLDFVGSKPKLKLQWWCQRHLNTSKV